MVTWLPRHKILRPSTLIGALIAFQMLALTMAPVAQVIAVKRMSTLLSVLFGHFFFGEKGMRSRLLGAAIMVSGVVIMSIR